MGLPNPVSSFIPSQLTRKIHETEEIKPVETRTSTPASESSTVPVQQEYKCPLCQETMATQKEFTQHIRAHNEVKPSPDPNDPTGQAKVYYCCMCRKMLSSFSSLDRHMLVHSGERPFSCERCGQTFTTNGNMHRHKRTHGSRDSRESDVSSGGGSQTSQTKPKGSTGSSNTGNGPTGGPNSVKEIGSASSQGQAASNLSQAARKRKASIDSMPSSGLGSGLTPGSDGMKNGGHVKCPICPESFYTER